MIYWDISNLVVSGDQLHKSLEESRKSNEFISESAGKTLEDCNHNQTYVNDTVVNIHNMGKIIDDIINKTSNMTSIMNHSSDMVMDIKDSLKNQEQLINEMDKLFSKVNDVSNKLKEIVHEEL